MRRLLLLLVGFALFTTPAFGWWDYGHETVATVASLNVQPATRQDIRQLLAHWRELDTPECPVRTIEEASVWPDCIKKLGDRFSYAYGWHFQDVDLCRPYDAKPPCADGNCVTAQIARNQRLLADTKLPARERLMALAFLVHLVGDLHQPLHASERDHDKGGNDVAAHYGVIAGRTNLHSIWDGLLADRAISSPPAGARGLVAGLSPSDIAAIQAGTPDDWARESWEISRDVVYPTATGAPACPPAKSSNAGLDEAEIQKLVPVLRQQVLRGGLRLAKMLDDAFAGRVPPRQRPGA